MTRKDYVAVAATLKEQLALGYNDNFDTVQETAWRLATVFANDNPRFDRERFLAACGVSV